MATGAMAAACRVTGALWLPGVSTPGPQVMELLPAVLPVNPISKDRLLEGKFSLQANKGPDLVPRVPGSLMASTHFFKGSITVF